VNIDNCKIDVRANFRSVGMGESEIVFIDLYPNQWVLVNQIEDSGRW